MAQRYSGCLMSPSEGLGGALQESSGLEFPSEGLGTWLSIPEVPGSFPAMQREQRNISYRDALEPGAFPLPSSRCPVC